MCSCKDRIILHEPTAAFEAIETWCPTHGYENDCWMCAQEQEGREEPLKPNHYVRQTGMMSTEICVRHAKNDCGYCFCYNCGKPLKVVGGVVPMAWAVFDTQKKANVGVSCDECHFKRFPEDAY